MIHNVVHNLCESLVTNIGDIADTGKRTPPTPITYLTQWKIVGNSEVHTDPYLTSWKVEGNSVVDNNAILSCGDLGQDGYYHVKISNGVNVYDIPLTEPLRKVNDVADSIEFPSDTEGKALVTRPLGSTDMKDLNWRTTQIGTTGYYRIVSYDLTNSIKKPASSSNIANVLTPIYTTKSATNTYNRTTGIGINANGDVLVYDPDYNQSDSATAFKAHVDGVELIYELETPITELVDVSPFFVSPTDTYTSANETPYSAFEYKKNVEIWSCGEYSEVDGKWHILVQPLGGSIADIALDEPLRKVNDVADTIEFPSDTEGKALVTRYFDTRDLGDMSYSRATTSRTNSNGIYRFYNTDLSSSAKLPSSDNSVATILSSKYNAISSNASYGSNTAPPIKGIAIATTARLYIYDDVYNQEDDATNLKNSLQGVELIYELATPTTELVDAPQIEEAESYTCEISQGGKAVSWSSFETN